MASSLPAVPVRRRTVLQSTVCASAAGVLVGAADSASGQTPAAPAPTPVAPDGPTLPVRLTVHGKEHALQLDPRTSLLDTLREHIHLTGTKKGCDHGQCGACTVLVNGERINSCLTLAVMHDGDKVTTVEGLANGQQLHPMQQAFIDNDGFQCGYCTPGQICSAVGMLDEARRGMPSNVSESLEGDIALSDTEIRERMSGNLCRCSAYPNIVAAIRVVAKGQP